MNYQIGLSEIEVESVEPSERFTVALAYPTNDHTRLSAFGPFKLKMAVNGLIAEGKFPLVVLSHGSRGNNLSYPSIVLALVKKGFIVAMPLHPKSNFLNSDLEGTVQNYINRPKHLKFAIDKLLSSNSFSKSLDKDKIAVIGHSIGGYTALAVAGASANTAHILKLYAKSPDLNDPYLAAAKNNVLESAKIETFKDSRIKALVLMAPLGILFSSKGALSAVDIPTLLLRAEKDDYLTEPYHSEVIMNNFVDQSILTYQTVKNAGHFSFISPIPDSIQNMFGVVAQDPEGFDREEYHQKLGEQIVEYLNLVLFEEYNCL